MAEGVGSLIRGALVAQLAAAKEDAQGGAITGHLPWAAEVCHQGVAACAREPHVASSRSSRTLQPWGLPTPTAPLHPPHPSPPAGKAVRETDKGFVMFRGAAPARPGGLPMLPVEEQSAEQQAEAVQEEAEQQMAAIKGVAARVLGISEGLEAVEEGDEEEEDDE